MVIIDESLSNLKHKFKSLFSLLKQKNFGKMLHNLLSSGQLFLHYYYYYYIRSRCIPFICLIMLLISQFYKDFHNSHCFSYGEEIEKQFCKSKIFIMSNEDFISHIIQNALYICHTLPCLALSKWKNKQLLNEELKC